MRCQCVFVGMKPYGVLSQLLAQGTAKLASPNGLSESAQHTPFRGRTLGLKKRSMQEKNMRRNLLRELSPREESTLCRIAQGRPYEAGLRAGDVSCPRNFGFIETAHGVPAVTPLGARRVAIMIRAAATQSAPASLQARRPTTS